MYVKQILVEKDSYYDSVFLMLISSEVKKVPGLREAVVAMGTQVNTELLREIGFSSPELDEATPNDLIIAVEGEKEETVRDALQLARELLTKKKRRRDEHETYRPVSLDTALKMVPDANLLIVSVPGRYAARQVRKALDNDLHVMLFSDNVSLEEEIELKTRAAEKGLLMMGPDCGTAVINGKPLCFANVLRRGAIGLVAASGTGLQEVTCSLDKLGQGVSQAIGTGGRDLKPEVGGTMMLMGIEALRRDPRTEVIVVISKPPAEEVARKVVRSLEDTGKPCVVHFIGLQDGRPSGKVRYAGNLEEAAGLAVALLKGETYQARTFTLAEEQVCRIVERETAGRSERQRYIRGLYTGGTLADEALVLFQRGLGRIYSNIQTRPELVLRDPHQSQEHTIVDLGEDVFTVGRPHPMIDPGTRVERIQKETADPEVALLLLDCVLGYGSCPDPAGAMADSLVQAKGRAADRGGFLSIVASVTGTQADPQNMEEQKEKLESIGCIVMPSNYQAAVLAQRIILQAGKS